ncbi:MAG: hypothetical protein K0Q53_90 [Massilibacillus sp.]|jgi:hypothetical protein|nr:hypothetical protein [Massilibacillus sp.]
MHDLWATLFLFSFIGLIIGLFKPKIMFLGNKDKTRKHVLNLYGTLTLIFLIFDSYTMPPINHDSTIKQSNVSNNVASITTNKPVNNSKQEFDAFYNNFKKYHDGLGDAFSKLQNSMDMMDKGGINPTDFYNYLKATENLLLIAWSDTDKMEVPKGLDDSQSKEVEQCIKYLSLSALTGKEAVGSLMNVMNNKNYMENKMNFENNIKQALAAHKNAGENIEKVKNEIYKQTAK